MTRKGGSALEGLVLGFELFPRFEVIGIGNATVDRSEVHTLARLVVADALGAPFRVDDEDPVAQADRACRARVLTRPADNAIIRDAGRHRTGPLTPRPALARPPGPAAPLAHRCIRGCR